MGTQHFFLGRAHLGSRQIDDNRVVPGLEIRPHHSYAYFCLRCGDIWARLVHDKAQLTQCLVLPCDKHGDGMLASPPSWQDEPRVVAEDWPEALILREFEMTVRHFEQHSI